MSQRKLKNILVTGGCGFIGSNFINYLFGLSATGEEAYILPGKYKARKCHQC